MKKIPEQGSMDPEALFRKGMELMSTARGRPDEELAAQYLSRAASAGHLKAMFFLGMSKWEGKGTPKDEAGAIDLWHKSAERGDTNSQRQLGVMYVVGPEDKRDTELAYYWLYLAKLGNDRQAEEPCEYVAEALSEQTRQRIEAKARLQMEKIQAASTGSASPSAPMTSPREKIEELMQKYRDDTARMILTLLTKEYNSLSLPFQADRDDLDNLEMFFSYRKTIMSSCLEYRTIEDDVLSMVPEVYKVFIDIVGQVRDDYYAYHHQRQISLQMPLLRNCFTYMYAKGFEMAYVWHVNPPSILPLNYSADKALNGKIEFRDCVAKDELPGMDLRVELMKEVFVDFQDMLQSHKLESSQDYRWVADAMACGLFWAAVMGLDKGMNSLGMY